MEQPLYPPPQRATIHFYTNWRLLHNKQDQAPPDRDAAPTLVLRQIATVSLPEAGASSPNLMAPTARQLSYLSPLFVAWALDDHGRLYSWHHGARAWCRVLALELLPPPTLQPESASATTEPTELHLVSLSVGRCTNPEALRSEELWAISSSGLPYRLSFVEQYQEPSSSSSTTSTSSKPSLDSNAPLADLLRRNASHQAAYWLKMPSPLRASIAGSSSASMRVIASLAANMEAAQTPPPPASSQARAPAVSDLSSSQSASTLNLGTQQQQQQRQYADLRCVSVGSSEHIWAIDTEFNLFRFEYRRNVGSVTSSREQQQLQQQQRSVLSTPQSYATRRIVPAVPSQRVWENAATLGRWIRVRGKSCTNISVGHDGEVWGVSVDGIVFRRLKATETLEAEQLIDEHELDNLTSNGATAIMLPSATSLNRSTATLHVDAAAALHDDGSTALAEAEEWDYDDDWKEYFVTAASADGAVPQPFATSGAPFSAFDDRATIVQVLVVNKDQVWCIDSMGQLYTRYDYMQFRPVFDSEVTVHDGEPESPFANATPSRSTATATSSSSSSSSASLGDGGINRKTLPPIFVRRMKTDGPEKQYNDGVYVSAIAIGEGGVLWGLTPCGRYTIVLQPQYLSLLTVSNFSKLWDDTNTGARLCDISFFRPRGPMGYFLLGDFAERSHLPFPLTYNFEAPPASRLVLVREEPVNCSPEDPPQPLLLPPVEYQRMWDDRNTGAKFGDVTLWRAVPPDGYVVLGHTASIGNRAAATPGVEGFFMCVHKSIAVPGDIFRAPLSASGVFWTDQGSGGTFDVSVWQVNGSDEVGMAPGSFLCTKGYGPPPPANEVWVLNINRDRWCH